MNSAVNLPNIETIGKSDPYVVINFQGLFYLGLLFFFCSLRCFKFRLLDLEAGIVK